MVFFLEINIVKKKNTIYDIEVENLYFFFSTNLKIYVFWYLQSRHFKNNLKIQNMRNSY